MENITRIQKNKMPDHDSIVLASLLVKDVQRLIRCIRGIVAVLVRYAMIAETISDNLRGSFEPARQHRKYSQRIEIALQNISITELPLAG
jgi:uncharacterized membrane protein